MQVLSPFRLSPYFRTRVWGFQDLAPWYDYKTDGEPIGEVWLTGEMCAAETSPLAGKSLSDIAKQHSSELLGPEHAGQEFPLLVKVLFPKEKLSVQVHPDDAMAQKYGDPRGKTECWYALDAEPDAKVALGIKPGVTPEEIRRGIEDAALEELLEWVPVHKGDMLYVDAGTVHAIGPGAVILETQQTSDLTYRMYDYGRPRELHLDKSFEAMRLKTKAGKVPPQAENSHTILVDEHYFRVERWMVQGSADAATLGNKKVQMFFVVDGEISVTGPGFEPFAVNRCQLAVIPAGATDWSLTSTRPSEIIRIFPQAV